jgi:hypothetical protein
LNQIETLMPEKQDFYQDAPESLNDAKEVIDYAVRYSRDHVDVLCDDETRRAIVLHTLQAISCGVRNGDLSVSVVTAMLKAVAPDQR